MLIKCRKCFKQMYVKHLRQKFCKDCVETLKKTRMNRINKIKRKQLNLFPDEKLIASIRRNRFQPKMIVNSWLM